MHRGVTVLDAAVVPAAEQGALGAEQRGPDRYPALGQASPGLLHCHCEHPLEHPLGRPRGVHVAEGTCRYRYVDWLVASRFREGRTMSGRGPSELLRSTLTRLAPGTELRDGLERILRGRTG